MANTNENDYRRENSTGNYRSAARSDTATRAEAARKAAEAEKARQQQKKYMIRRILAAVIVLAVVALLIFGIIKLVQAISRPKEEEEAPVLTLVSYEAGSRGPAVELLYTETGKAAVANGAQIYYETDLDQISFHVLGSYKVNVICRAADGTAKKYAVTINVKDTVPPEGVARDCVTRKGEALSISDFIVPGSVKDETDVAVMFVNEPDYGTAGVQTVDILLEDRGGNQTRLTASLTVTED